MPDVRVQGVGKLTALDVRVLTAIGTGPAKRRGDVHKALRRRTAGGRPWTVDQSTEADRVLSGLEHLGLAQFKRGWWRLTTAGAAAIREAEQ